jgi:hypothetical protein
MRDAEHLRRPGLPVLDPGAPARRHPVPGSPPHTEGSQTASARSCRPPPVLDSPRPPHGVKGANASLRDGLRPPLTPHRGRASGTYRGTGGVWLSPRGGLSNAARSGRHLGDDLGPTSPADRARPTASNTTTSTDSQAPTSATVVDHVDTKEVGRSCRSAPLGTFWGPHVVRDAEHAPPLDASITWHNAP